MLQVNEKQYRGKCRQIKPVSEFGVYRIMPDGLNWACKECARIRRIGYYHKNRQKEIKKSSTYNKKNPDIVKNAALKRKYGITLEQYLDIYRRQNGLCQICKNHSDTFEDDLVVDHNHTTGKVRGLLCHGCNLSLGNIKENINSAIGLVEYIRENSTENK